MANFWTSQNIFHHFNEFSQNSADADAELRNLNFLKVIFETQSRKFWPKLLQRPVWPVGLITIYSLAIYSDGYWPISKYFFSKPCSNICYVLN